MDQREGSKIRSSYGLLSDPEISYSEWKSLVGGDSLNKHVRKRIHMRMHDSYMIGYRKCMPDLGSEEAL